MAAHACMYKEEVSLSPRYCCWQLINPSKLWIHLLRPLFELTRWHDSWHEAAPGCSVPFSSSSDRVHSFILFLTNTMLVLFLLILLSLSLSSLPFSLSLTLSLWHYSTFLFTSHSVFIFLLLVFIFQLVVFYGICLYKNLNF